MTLAEQSLDEMADRINQYESKIVELGASLKKANDDSEKEHTAEETKKEEEAAIKKAEDMEKEKTAKRVAAIKKAMEHEDKDGREAALKEAMQDHDHKNDKMAEMEDKMKKQEAMMEEYKKEAAMPKLTMLASMYKNANVDEAKINEYKASWEKMSTAQLQDGIDRIRPFVSNFESVEASASIPVSPSGMSEYEASKDESLSKLEKTDHLECF